MVVVRRQQDLRCDWQVYTHHTHTTSIHKMLSGQEKLAADVDVVE